MYDKRDNQVGELHFDKVIKEEHIKLFINHSNHETEFFVELQDADGKILIPISYDLYFHYKDEINYLRKHKKINARKLDSYLDFEEIQSRYHLEEHIITSEKINQIRSVLSRCSPTQSRRFVLYFVYGFTYKEIAEKEACSIQAVQNSIKKILKTLNVNNL